MTWHLEADTIGRYQEGRTDRVGSAAVERHLEGCAKCRALVKAPDTHWAEQSWASIADAVDTPETTPVEKIVVGLGAKPHVARLLAVTPSMRPSWLFAVTISLLFAGYASTSGPEPFNFFLVLAPIIPVLGVGIAYGRLADPAHEMTVGMPFDPMRLLLLRSGAVTGVTVLMATTVDLIMGFEAGFGLWLLPTLSLTAVTLALGTRFGLGGSALAAVGAWLLILVVVATRAHNGLDDVTGALAQTLFLVVFAVATLVLVHRHDHYRRGDL